MSSGNSTGALIQCTALGIQNSYLCLDPQYTFFKRTYKRHTNYAVQVMSVACQGTNVELGRINTFKLSRNGDLIAETFFCCYMPVCGVDTTANAFAKVERGFVTNRGILNTGALGISDGKYSHPTEFSSNPDYYDSSTIYDTKTSDTNIDEFNRSGENATIGSGNSNPGIDAIAGSALRFPGTTGKVPIPKPMTDSSFAPGSSSLKDSVNKAQEFMTGTDHANVAYVNALGHAMIDNVEIDIGGATIHTIPGEFMHIWYNMMKKPGDTSNSDNLFMYGDGTGAPLPETGSSAPHGFLENINPIYNEAHRYKLCKYKLKLPKPAAASSTDARENPAVEHGQLLNLRFFDFKKITTNDAYQKEMSGTTSTEFSGGIIGSSYHLSDASGKSIFSFDGGPRALTATNYFGQSPLNHPGPNNTVTNNTITAGRDGRLPVGFKHSRVGEILPSKRWVNQSPSLSSLDTDFDGALYKSHGTQTNGDSNLVGGWHWASSHPAAYYVLNAAKSMDVTVPVFADVDLTYATGGSVELNELTVLHGSDFPADNDEVVAKYSSDEYADTIQTPEASGYAINKGDGIKQGGGTISVNTRNFIKNGGDDKTFEPLGTAAGSYTGGSLSTANAAEYGGRASRIVATFTIVDAYKEDTKTTNLVNNSATLGNYDTDSDRVPLRNRHGTVDVEMNYALHTDSAGAQTGCWTCLRVAEGNTLRVPLAAAKHGYYLVCDLPDIAAAMQKWNDNSLGNTGHTPYVKQYGTAGTAGQSQAMFLGPYYHLGGSSGDVNWPSNTDAGSGVNTPLNVTYNYANNGATLAKTAADDTGASANVGTQGSNGIGATMRVRICKETEFQQNSRLAYRLDVADAGTGYKVGDTLKIKASSLPGVGSIGSDALDIKFTVGQIQPDAVSRSTRIDSSVNVSYVVELFDPLSTDGNLIPLPNHVAMVTMVGEPKNNEIRGTNQGHTTSLCTGAALKTISETSPDSDGLYPGKDQITVEGFLQHYGTATPSADAGNPFAASDIGWNNDVLANQVCPYQEWSKGTNVLPFAMGGMSHAEFTVFSCIGGSQSASNGKNAALLKTHIPGAYVRITKQNADSKTKSSTSGFMAAAPSVWIQTAKAGYEVAPYSGASKSATYAMDDHAHLTCHQDARPEAAAPSAGWFSGNFGGVGGDLQQKTLNGDRPSTTSGGKTIASALCGLPFAGAKALTTIAGNNTCDATSFYESCNQSRIQPLKSQSGITKVGDDPEFSESYAMTNTDPLASCGGFDTVEFLALCPSLVGGAALQRRNDTGVFDVNESADTEAGLGGVAEFSLGFGNDPSQEITASNAGEFKIVDNSRETTVTSKEDGKTLISKATQLERRTRMSTLQAVGAVAEENLRGSDGVSTIDDGAQCFTDTQGGSRLGSSSRAHISDMSKVQSRLGPVMHKHRANFVTSADYASGTVSLSNGSKKALKDGFAKRAHMSTVGNCDHPEGTGRCVKVMVPIPFWFCADQNVGDAGRTQALPMIALQYHDVMVNVKLRSLDDLIQTDHEARNMGLRCSSVTGLGGAIAGDTNSTGRLRMDTTQQDALTKFIDDSVFTAGTKNGGFAFDTAGTVQRKTFAGNKVCFGSDCAAWGGPQLGGKPLDVADKSKMAAWTGQSGRTDNGGRSFCVPAGTGGTSKAMNFGSAGASQGQAMNGGIIEGHLLVQTVFLDSQERRLFASHEHEFLIKQLQTYEKTQVPAGSSTGTPWTISCDLPFNHPVSALFWVLQRPESQHTRNWFRYEATQMAGDELMLKSSLKFNNHERDGAGEDQMFLRAIQPQTYFGHVPNGGVASQQRDNEEGGAKNIYMYSFAQHPSEWWPSGTMNFSRIDSAQLVVKCKSHASQAHFGHQYCYAGGGYRKLADEIEFATNATQTAEHKTDEFKRSLYYGNLDLGVNLRVYAQNFNILTINTGMGSLRYSN